MWWSWALQASQVPLSAVLVSKPVADKVQYGEYGATYGAGPLAMAALKATIEIVVPLLPNVREVSNYMSGRLRHVAGVTELRGMGLLLGIKTTVKAASLQATLLEKGIITGTSGEPDVLRILPPLTLSHAHVDTFLKALTDELRS